MAESRQGQPQEILIKIVAVKMKIKFPCRMALEFNKQPLTREVPSGEGSKFLFNEEVTLKAEVETQTFDIIANLYTDKGTRYTSGIMKLLCAELTRSQGERLIIPLTKCLDPDAFCEIKVEQSSLISKSMLKVHKSNSKVLNSYDDLKSSSDLKKINSQKYLIAETRSEVHSPPTPPLPISEEGRGREAAKTQIFKTFTKSPTSKYSNLKYLGISHQMKNMSEFPVEQVTSQRPSFSESEVIRQSYMKLKEKFKKESELSKEETHKRMLLQANQNNFKLEIMKLKLKCETQEKELNEKNEKMKNIISQLSQLQKKDIDLAYLKEECSSFQTKIRLNEDTIQALHNENDSLKKLMNEKYKIKEETISQLRHELEFALAKIQEQKHEIELQGKTKDSIILGKNNDLKMRGDTIDRQKKMIRELEDQAETKLFDFEKSLSADRNSLQVKIDELKAKNGLVVKEKEDLNIKISLLQEQIEKQKSSFNALDYSKKLMGEEIIGLNKQIAELRIVKQKFNQLQKDHKLLEEQFVTVRKSLQLALHDKEININDLVVKFDQNRVRNQKSKTEYEEKTKNLMLKLQDLELIHNNTKNSLQKSSRGVDNLSKEVSSLKKTNNTLREELKVAEKRIISLEGDHSSHFSKYERQTDNFKFLLEKYKEEKKALEKENDVLKEKIQKLEELRTQFERKQGGWKLRERHYEEKYEKDSTKYKDGLNKYELLHKQQETAILDLNLGMESIDNEIKQHRKKIHDFELADIKTKEKEERQKKELKSKEEKITSLQSQLKQKVEDLLTQGQKSKQLEWSLNEKDLQISKLKEEFVQENNKNMKQVQIIQLLKKDITKLNHLTAELQSTISSKEQSEQYLRSQIKNSREETAKEKIRGTKIENDFEKFKDSINDIIRLEFARILSTPNPQRIAEKLRESQVSNSKSEASGRSRMKISLDAGQLISTLADKLHETKNSLWKMTELNRAFKAENSKLMEEFQSVSNKHEFTKLELHRDIQQLQDEMNIIIDDKESEVQNYDNLVIDLNGKIKEKELQIEQMRTEVDQYNAIITGLRTDFETNNDLNEKKVNSLKSCISELTERVEYLNLNVACLEDKNHQLEEKTIELENEVILHKQLLIKNEKAAIDGKENQTDLKQKLEQLKKQLKSLQEMNEELDIQLNTEKQTKEKYISMLEEEEKKSQKLNEFVSALIVQKQSAIKRELERSEEVNTLENKLFENTQHNEIIQEDNQSLRKKNEQNKEEMKNLTKSVKALEKQLSEEKTKFNRSLQKIKERETDIQIKKEYIKDLEDKYRQFRDKNYKQIKELSNELQDKNSSSVSMSKELSDKIIKLQGQNKKFWQDSLIMKSQIQALTKELHSKNDQIEDLEIALKKVQDERVNWEDQVASKEFILHERVDQIQKLEEIVEEQRVSLYTINGQFESYQKQFDLNINDLTNDYNFKIQTIQRQFEQKIELEQKECQFAKEKLKQLEEELNRAQLSKKSHEIESDQTKKLFEQKLKKLQSERLNNILAKNNQIKQLSEESKVNLSNLHEKESQIRKLNLQLEQLKLSTGRTQQFYTYSLEHSKNKEKILSKEVQGWKAKENNSISYKQSLLSSLFQNEVEVRKVLAATTKKIMETCSQADSDRLLSILKGLEANVITAMMARIDTP